MRDTVPGLPCRLGLPGRCRFDQLGGVDGLERRLREGEASVGELVDLCGLSQSSVSQHLAKMREGGILQTRREAQTIFYRLANPHVEALMEFMCERVSEMAVRP